MKFHSLYFSFVFILFSCQEKVKLTLPEFDNTTMSSAVLSFPLDVNFTPSTYPHLLKRFEQKNNDEYLNILEYDRNGNLIYKYYQQYVSEYWNGKYVTCIERFFYDDKKQLVKVITLHSNTGASVEQYHYDSVGNLTSIDTSEIDANGTNNNPWSDIKALTKVDDFDKNKNVTTVNNKKNHTQYIFEYNFARKEVKAFYKDQNQDLFYTLYRFNKANQLISKTNYSQGIPNYENSYFIDYKGDHKIIKEYNHQKKLIQISTEFPQHNFTYIQTVNKDNKSELKRKYFGKTLIDEDYSSQGDHQKTREKYDLDSYNIPVKMVSEQNGKIDSTLIFTNKYEFY